MQSGSDSGFASETSSKPAWRGAGRPGGGGGTPQGGPDLPGILTKKLIEAPVPGSGVPGWDTKSDQLSDSRCAPPHSWYNCGTGRR